MRTMHRYTGFCASYSSSLPTGHLSVCLSGSWKERWCVLRGGSLYLHKDRGDQRLPVIVVPLKAAEVVPGGLGPKHPFSFRILQGGIELASLEVMPVNTGRPGLERGSLAGGHDGHP